jgi:hypothetical protein
VIRLLYALVRPAAGRAGLRGVRGEPLQLLTVAGIGALFGEMAAAPAASPRNLRAYHDVISRIAARHAAVIPVRFGTTVTDPGELTFILRSRATSFRRLLTFVRGRRQMTVRLVDVPDDDRREAAPTARGATGAAYLQQRAASHRRLRSSAACRRLRDVVHRWIRGERIERHQRVITVYHLVPRAAADRYRRAVTGLGPDALHVSGPFPPFAFADPFDLDSMVVRHGRRRGHRPQAYG